MTKRMEVLIAAKEALKFGASLAPGQRCRGTFASDTAGRAIYPTAPEAKQFCAAGAILRATSAQIERGELDPEFEEAVLWTASLYLGIGAGADFEKASREALCQADALYRWSDSCADPRPAFERAIEILKQEIEKERKVDEILTELYTDA